MAYNLQGGDYNLQGSAGSDLQGGTYNPQTTASVTSASPSATSPARTTYVNNVAKKKPALSGTYRYEDSPTIYGNYQGDPNYAFHSADEFTGAGGVFGQEELRQRTGTTDTTGGTTATAPKYTPPAKSAYVSYLESIFNPKQLNTANANLNDLNKRTSEELLRGRNTEDILRKNDIGQLEGGQQYGLNENARLTNKSLADLAISKGYQQDYVDRILGAGKELNDYQTEQAKPISGDKPLIKFNPETGQYEQIYTPPNEGLSFGDYPSSYQEYLLTDSTPTSEEYNAYQTEDANRKRSVSNTYINSGTGLNPYQTFQANNTIQDNARQDPDVKIFPDVRGAYEQAQQAAQQRNSLGDIVLMRTIAKITDPTSSVREEEYATFQNAIGTLPRYGITLTTGMVGKGQLTQAGRDAILGQISNIYNQRAAAYQSKIDYYNTQAAPYGGSVPSYTAPNNNDPLGLGL
jgi:hypothetical protein